MSTLYQHRPHRRAQKPLNHFTFFVCFLMKMSVSSRRNAHFGMNCVPIFATSFFQTRKSTPDDFLGQNERFVETKRNKQRVYTGPLAAVRFNNTDKIGRCRLRVPDEVKERPKKVNEGSLCQSLTGAHFRRCGTAALVLVSTEFKSLC